MSMCCCSLAGTVACQTCPQSPFAVMSNLMTPQPTIIRDIMVNPQIEKPMANADRIRAMTDEELADFLLHICDWNWLDWLKASADKESEG